MEIQLPATDKRAVGTVDDIEMEDGLGESTRARTIGGVEVCVLDDNYDERLAELARRSEDSEEGDVDRRHVPEHIHRMLCRSPAEEGLISEEQVHATRSGEPMCHDAVRKARAKKLKHSQDHNVFEVVWLRVAHDGAFQVAARQ